MPEVLGLLRLPGAKLHGMNLGGTLQLPWGSVHMVLALHSSGVAGGCACGYIIRIGGKTVYFAGDTAIFSDMKFLGERDAIDYAMLPIGDNFTMGPEDAALAASWLHAKHVIPIHYNTWPIIAQDPKEFKKLCEAASDANVLVVKPGESIELA